eukprot:GHRQ01035829.1.p2 GENE.GHRQ01035829.1~~GHRQ01035829.1.p2  ORF type:complete len:103 (-),score=17.60 GHRQ01035829.1:93-401(-)
MMRWGCPSGGLAATHISHAHTHLPVSVPVPGLLGQVQHPVGHLTARLLDQVCHAAQLWGVCLREECDRLASVAGAPWQPQRQPQKNKRAGEQQQKCFGSIST